MTPNRVVAVLTPLIFAPLAGAVAAWLAEHIPGYQVDKSALEEIFIAGALIALVPATQWLHGWQKYEERGAQRERDEALADEAVHPASQPQDLEALDELEDFDELDEFDDELFAEDEQLVGAGG